MSPTQPMAIPDSRPVQVVNGRHRQIPLEVTTYGSLQAIRTEKMGAKRVLLCRQGSSAVGGLTPSTGELIELGSSDDFHLPRRVLIRPRPAPFQSGQGDGPDFCYTTSEYTEMLESIHALKRVGMLNPTRSDGFVFSCLMYGPDSEGKVSPMLNESQCRDLIVAAKPYNCCFGWGFDALVEADVWKDALRDLKSYGFTGVMTGGGHGLFDENIDTITTICHHLPQDIQLVIARGHAHPKIQYLRKRIHDHNNPHTVWMNGECLHPQGLGCDEEVESEEIMGMVHYLGLQATDWKSPRDIGIIHYY